MRSLGILLLWGCWIHLYLCEWGSLLHKFINQGHQVIGYSVIVCLLKFGKSLDIFKVIFLKFLLMTSSRAIFCWASDFLSLMCNIGVEVHFLGVLCCNVWYPISYTPWSDTIVFKFYFTVLHVYVIIAWAPPGNTYSHLWPTFASEHTNT